MNVILISPGYPSEMPHFTRGLAQVGAKVFGIGDQPPESLPELARRSLSGYLQLDSLWNEEAAVDAVRRWKGAARVERIECLWEPFMLLGARLREALGAPGLTLEQTVPFRDKERMKRCLEEAGLRVPRHFRATSAAECWSAAERIGFPLILKPVAGAGSADTYRVDEDDQLRSILPRLIHVPEVSVEEFIDGEEYTYDTICVEGRIDYFNVAWYRPRPLIARSNEWISPQVIALREVEQPHLKAGLKLGEEVIRALGFKTGFTHMEWYRTSDGEAVFGEIGARPPGAHQVDQMNFACDIDVFRCWAEAVCWGGSPSDFDRKYNVATIFKRAQGQGTIRRIEGLESLKQRFESCLVWENLLPVGSQRRNWLQTLLSDGFVVVRHPLLEPTLEMADAFGQELQLLAS